MLCAVAFRPMGIPPSPPPQPWRHRPSRGFVLPLAIGTSAVLLLGSAAVHSLALHSRLRARSQIQKLSQNDQLRSAAMAFLAQAAHRPQACLLQWSSQHWEDLANTCPDASPTELRQGETDALHWLLLGWQPTAAGAQLQLVVRDNGAAGELSVRRLEGGFQLREGLQRLPATAFEPQPPQEVLP